MSFKCEKILHEINFSSLLTWRLSTDGNFYGGTRVVWRFNTGNRLHIEKEGSSIRKLHLKWVCNEETNRKCYKVTYWARYQKRWSWTLAIVFTQQEGHANNRVVNGRSICIVWNVKFISFAIETIIVFALFITTDVLFSRL